MRMLKLSAAKLITRRFSFIRPISLQQRSVTVLTKPAKMDIPEEISSNKSFGGYQKVFRHQSKVLGCSMNFGVYLPPQAKNKKLPVIFWLSGLTCSEKNFIEKSGMQKHAARFGLIVINPDTSPRGLNIPGDGDSWDLGEGAGFYVDAKMEPWANNYKMFSYVTKELIDLVQRNFPVQDGIQSIMGHSMGGHGALICALKNPGLFKCVSAFAPISNPINCPWGKKAFNAYIGSDEEEWKQWDATELMKTYNGPELPIFLDQGLKDQFYSDKQLLPESLVEVCKKKGYGDDVISYRNGYDHSYYYIATFIEEHVERHLAHLGVL